MASKAAGTAVSGRDVMERLSDQFPDLSTGDRAQLRRIYLTGRPRADGVVMGLLHGAGVDLDKVQATPSFFERWKLVAHVAALLSGTAAKKPHGGKPLGEMLHDAGVSENRLLRLTSADGEPLRHQIVFAARLLAQKGTTAVDLWSIYNLFSRTPATLQKTRVRLAQSYYAAKAKSVQGTQP